MCLGDPYIILALMPSRLIFLNPTLSEIQRNTCPTCANNMRSRFYLINTNSASQKNPPAPLMTPGILQSRRRRRYLERVWRKSLSHLDRSRYSKQCNYCNKQMAKAKTDYYTNTNNAENPRQLWNCVNKIVPRKPPPTLSNHVSIKA